MSVDIASVATPCKHYTLLMYLDFEHLFYSDNSWITDIDLDSCKVFYVE
jgi:hypothetical protein